MILSLIRHVPLNILPSMGVSLFFFNKEAEEMQMVFKQIESHYLSHKMQMS